MGGGQQICLVFDGTISDRLGANQWSSGSKEGSIDAIDRARKDCCTSSVSSLLLHGLGAQIDKTHETISKSKMRAVSV